EQEHINEVIIGWYHSHPKMGAHFFSATDIATQKRYQHFLNQAVGLVLDPYNYMMSGQPKDLDIHVWRVDEKGFSTEISFKILQDTNMIIINILEHLKRQKVLESAVSQIIYSLNPKLEQSILEMLEEHLEGALVRGRETNFRKVILFSALIQSLVVMGIFLIIWAMIILIF
ncbi:MAG: hypothetical protein ACFFD2_28690, partial [Promethearchaeota archaeon]